MGDAGSPHPSQLTRAEGQLAQVQRTCLREMRCIIKYDEGLYFCSLCYVNTWKGEGGGGDGPRAGSWVSRLRSPPSAQALPSPCAFRVGLHTGPNEGASG